MGHTDMKQLASILRAQHLVMCEQLPMNESVPAVSHSYNSRTQQQHQLNTP